MEHPASTSKSKPSQRPKDRLPAIRGSVAQALQSRARAVPQVVQEAMRQGSALVCCTEVGNFSIPQMTELLPGVLVEMLLERIQDSPIIQQLTAGQPLVPAVMTGKGTMLDAWVPLWVQEPDTPQLHLAWIDIATESARLKGWDCPAPMEQLDLVERQRLLLRAAMRQL